MSIGQIIVLTAVIGAFVVFAVVLAWGDYRAQELARRIRDRGQKQTVPTPSGLNTQKSAVVRPVPEPARWPQGADDRLQHVA
jgi:hypothetical protein